MLWLILGSLKPISRFPKPVTSKPPSCEAIQTFRSWGHNLLLHVQDCLRCPNLSSNPARCSGAVPLGVDVRPIEVWKLAVAPLHFARPMLSPPLQDQTSISVWDTHSSRFVCTCRRTWWISLRRWQEHHSTHLIRREHVERGSEDRHISETLQLSWSKHASYQHRCPW